MGFELDNVDLTWIAEALGNDDGPESAGLLLRFAEHPSPLVREGAIYGLANRMNDIPFARQTIANLLDDESEGVREAAKEALRS